MNLVLNYARNNNFIVVASYNIQNGINPSELQLIIDELLDDIYTKLAINNSQVFLLGFSGGARVALSIAQNYQNISGVIACSAGYQSTDISKCIPIIGIAGNTDMNYLEIIKMNEILTNKSCPNIFKIFKGNHRWPNEYVINEAIDEIRILSSTADTSISNKYLIIKKKQISDLINSNNTDSLLSAYYLLVNSSSIFNDRYFDSIKNLLYTNKKVIEKINFIHEIQIKENNYQQEISSAFQSANIKWLANKINLFRNFQNASEENEYKNMAIRLINFISLAAYSFSNHYLRNHNWEECKKYLSIYQQSDPYNPDYHYLMACYLANNNKTEEAANELLKSIELGLSDIDKIKNDPLLYPLKDNEKLKSFFN